MKCDEKVDRTVGQVGLAVWYLAYEEQSAGELRSALQSLDYGAEMHRGTDDLSEKQVWAVFAGNDGEKVPGTSMAEWLTAMVSLGHKHDCELVKILVIREGIDEPEARNLDR